MSASDNSPGLDGVTPAEKGRKTNDQAIYDNIYEAVLTQRLPPGSRLPEVALSELYGVSRSIIRKALTRLASDHVIEQKPNQMAMVPKPSVSDTRQIFAARRLVEGEEMRVTAGQLDPSQLKDLRSLVQQEKAAHDSHRDQDRVHCSMAIHRFVAAHCPNRVLGEMMRELVLRTSIVIGLYKSSGITACFLGDDHARLADLLASGDGDAASTLVHEHLCTLENLLDLDDRAPEIDLASILKPQG